MRWNVIELAENGRYAKLHRGFLVVMQGDEELGRVVIDEMNCLLLTAEQATLSKPVMVRLAEEGVPIVVCGSNYHPVSITLPYTAHHHSTKILQHQLNAGKSHKKRLWQLLVKTKIQNQLWALKQIPDPPEEVFNRMERLVNLTRSGDPDNTESQAARIYWKALMGSKFNRNSESNDFTNSALNYGYSIIRAACARAVVAAGLLPALGLHHKNQNNPFCLVDDLMEIYRPLVDIQVHFLGTKEQINPDTKQVLARTLQADVCVADQTTTVNSSMQTLAFSLVKSYEKKTLELQLPQLMI